MCLSGSRSAAHPQAEHQFLESKLVFKRISTAECLRKVKYVLRISTEGLARVTGDMGWLLAHQPSKVAPLEGWGCLGGRGLPEDGWLLFLLDPSCGKPGGNQLCVCCSLEVLPQRVKRF